MIAKAKRTKFNQREIYRALFAVANGQARSRPGAVEVLPEQSQTEYGNDNFIPRQKKSLESVFKKRHGERSGLIGIAARGGNAEFLTFNQAPLSGSSRSGRGRRQREDRDVTDRSARPFRARGRIRLRPAVPRALPHQANARLSRARGRHLRRRPTIPRAWRLFCARGHAQPRDYPMPRA
jgi:hypothetical protein